MKLRESDLRRGDARAAREGADHREPCSWCEGEGSDGCRGCGGAGVQWSVDPGRGPILEAWYLLPELVNRPCPPAA